MNSDFEELLSIFNRNEVKYLIVGGYAMIFTISASWSERGLHTVVKDLHRQFRDVSRPFVFGRS